jgi:hypothetical protein
MPSSWLNMHELDVVHMVLPLSNKINNKVIIFIPYGSYLTSTSPYIILLYVKRINLNPLHLYTTLKVNIVYFKQVVDHHFFHKIQKEAYPLKIMCLIRLLCHVKAVFISCCLTVVGNAQPMM